ncbi:MAG: hypothetical protein NC347_15050 [Clostridium sp.]|nr:hypothetical protein [Clostridium sp.]
MQTGEKKNVIIYIMMLAVLISLTGAGFESSYYAVFQDEPDVMQCFVESELLPEDNITNIRVVEPGSALIRLNRMRKAGSMLSGRFDLSILCVWPVLPELFWFSNRERFYLYGNRNRSGVGYPVIYMENKDGRKRIS